MSEPNNKIVTFADLANDLDRTLAQRDKLNELLNCPPREAWLKRHKFIDVRNPDTGQSEKLKYIPITTVRTLMKAIFQRVRREVRSINIQANSAIATVRVHYRDPITGEWEWQDGVGAAPLQTDAGASATDISALKTNAVQIGVPAAVSYAYKNACEEIGKIFGSDLQKSGIPFVGLYSTPNDTTTTSEATPVTEVITTQF